MQITKLLYLEDFTILNAAAKVLEVREEEGRAVVILDETIFYPQGGGQPYDNGFISGQSGKFIVEEVRFVEGIVKHIGKFESGNIAAGEEVELIVDKERRELNSRIHSGGHVLDMAIYDLNLPWIPGKGYHFPQGPYVEYAGSLDGMDREKLKVDIENSSNKFIAENRQTKLVLMEKEKMHEVCRNVPENLPEGKPARVVMYGDFGVPCGGTHVSQLSEIKSMTVRKIKQEGSGTVRVAYDVSR